MIVGTIGEDFLRLSPKHQEAFDNSLNGHRFNQLSKWVFGIGYKDFNDTYGDGDPVYLLEDYPLYWPTNVEWDSRGLQTYLISFGDMLFPTTSHFEFGPAIIINELTKLWEPE